MARQRVGDVAVRALLPRELIVYESIEVGLARGTRRLGHLWETTVEHEPWPLITAAVDVLEQTRTAAAVPPAPLDEPVVHFSSAGELGPSRRLFS
ncbi:DUF2071 domain-containing protein [Streptomyces canus]|uniref:DUF2071 domain-containing protein n=1 Tax=Streptomyces canus TaxID=58343 RepID=UPI003863DF5D|nr:DUF2071 domain-containing protein [Streptomyces canus]